MMKCDTPMHLVHDHVKQIILNKGSKVSLLSYALLHVGGEPLVLS